MDKHALSASEVKDLGKWPDELVDDYVQNASDLADVRYIEPWREIGATGRPAFKNGWSNVGGANDETLAFRVDSFKSLYIKGYISGGTTADGTVVFTLPNKFYWPTKTIRRAAMFVQGSTENSFQLEIQTDGDVAIYGVSGASPLLSMHDVVSLDN